MKKYFFLFFFCATAMLLPAQKTMYVWQGNGYTEFAVSEVDSVTFSEPAPTPVLPEGALSGLFSVSPTRQVRFSQGNLQYTQSTDTWSFAEHQYDFIGTDNVIGGTVEPDYRIGDAKYGTALADTIDLFGWSGSTGAAKWGISISRDDADYSGDFVDWGQNPISNGGNEANLWRTLTEEEWEYLRWHRPNASELVGIASVNGVNGLILLPDGWRQPVGISFKSGFSQEYTTYAYAAYQSFTAAEWQRMESAGAVFFPASGHRLFGGAKVNRVGGDGRCWSATPADEREAYYFYFHSDEAYTRGYSEFRDRGHSVRLVQDVPGDNNNGGDKPEDVVIDKPDGILPGLFTINASGKQIQFSMGNLQYTQSTQTWSFAAQQYEMLGTDNVDGDDVAHDVIHGGDAKSGTALADKIDLFGWSGSIGTAKWGIGTSTAYADYSGDFVDWGQNIGDGTTWRTLTFDEWNNLLNTRANASSLMGVARINLTENGSKYVNGLILLPDNWTAPEDVTFKSGVASEYTTQAYADYQTLTLNQWQTLEQAGAVFFPASGCRNGTDVSNVGCDGSYWSSAMPYVENYAWYLRFYSGEAGMYGCDRNHGHAVRLVRDVK